MGDYHFCTIKQAEELAHAAYLLSRKEEAQARHEMAKAFEERLKALETKLSGRDYSGLTGRLGPDDIAVTGLNPDGTAAPVP